MVLFCSRLCFFVSLFVLNKLLRPLTADVFCFLFLFSSRKQDFQFRCVPDRVSDAVFLAGWVTVLQRALAVLVRSCSCFLRHAFGAPAKAPRVLLPHVTGSCCVRAVLRCRGAACRAGGALPAGPARAAMDGSLPASQRVRLRLPLLSAGGRVGLCVRCLAGQGPGSPANAQAQQFCSLLLLKLLVRNQSASCCLLRRRRGEMNCLLSVLSRPG